MLLLFNKLKRLVFYPLIVTAVFLYLLAAYFELNTRIVIKESYNGSYHNSISLLNPEFPGRGISDYPNNLVADIPKSYAMILSAEVNRFHNSETEMRPVLIDICGWWLLEHSDEDKDGIIGWGLPFSWDAYGDGSANPINTEYTITTGIVINALIDWIEMDFSAPRVKIIDTIIRAIKPYLDSRHQSPSGLFAYSLEPSDKPYDCFNPAAYLAGQMQRFSQYLEDPDFVKKLLKKADQVMLIMAKYKELDPYGGWYWPYSLQEPTTPNDLAHALYIIEGIWNYIEFGGAHPNRFDWEAIYLHVDSFTGGHDNAWSAWPNFFEHGNGVPPRLYGLGMALYVVSKNDPNSSRPESLMKFADSYMIPNGHYAKWPKIKPYDKIERPVIQEYEAYYIYGRSKFLFREKGSNLIARQIRKTNEEGYIAVPFTFFDTADYKIDLIFHLDNLQGKLIFDDIKEFRLPIKTIPIKILKWKSNHLILFTRQLWSSQIQCFLLDKNSGVWAEIHLPEDIAGLHFRQATVFKGRVIFILYNSIENRNFIYSLLPSIDNKTFIFDHHFSKAIQFDIKYGYEHQPHILPGIHNGQLFFACGGAVYTLFFDSRDSQSISTKLIFNKKGWRVVEFIANAEGAFGLYQVNDKQNIFLIYDFQRNKIVARFNERNIPYRLSIKNGQAAVSRVKAPMDLEAVFLTDLKNSAASGIMSAGINNFEGEVIWSQSYYLGGFIDFLTKNRSDENNAALIRLNQLINSRLNFEMALIDRLILEGPGLDCKVFSINRVPSKFAVQSGKLLLLFKRYIHDTKNQIKLDSFPKFFKKTVSLEHHMENITLSDDDDPWIQRKRYYLKWPKGVPFVYDGVGIPFNHQNCWAAGVLYLTEQYPVEQETSLVAKDIIELFLEIEGFRDSLPRYSTKFENSSNYYKWRYWWGKAKDGWKKEDEISINSPSYVGDGENIAIPRYRTFDAIAVLCAGLIYSDIVDNSLIEYFSQAVEEDGLELFLIPYLKYYNKNPEIKRKHAVKYLRVVSQPDFRNAMWAYKKLSYALSNNQLN